MLLLSHRGYWKSAEEKNRINAFERSFALGFGTETDLRDYRGALVISHDIADEHSLPLADFFDLYRQMGTNLPLALNIKADGLQAKLESALDRYAIRNYFVFDFSIPDGLLYLNAGQPIFTRQSEYEAQPAFYAQASGVWMDGFHGDWMQEQEIAQHLDAGKRVCLVSPELHQRPHLALWQRLAALPFVSVDALILCTDYPEEARRFFNG